MKQKYVGSIDKIEKIIVSDPDYDQDVTGRFEKNYDNIKDWKVEICINDLEDIFCYGKEKIKYKGIEFSILLKNPELKELTLDMYNNTKNIPKGLKIINTDIFLDTACVAMGINNNAKSILGNKDVWQPSCALKTLADGQFGGVIEAKNGEKTEFIKIDGFLDEDTDYNIDDIIEYLNYMFEIKDLRLQKEYKSDELNRVLYKVPGDRPVILEIEKNLKAEQELVGGLIEAVDFTDNTCLICNEEGKLQALMPNLKYGREFIVGNVFVIGCTEDGEFRSLTDEEIGECVDKLNEMDINKKQLFEEEEI
jgi:hypothetical protein